MINRIKRNFTILKSGIQEADRVTFRRHLILFILTAFTIFAAGSNFSSRTRAVDRYVDAAIYAFALLALLASYAITRYIQARSYGLYAELPLFIPMPLFSPFGTFGVLTKTAHVGVHTHALFDVAFWPPVISFVFSVLMLFAGTMLSDVVPGNAQFENPLVLVAIARVLKEIPHGYDLAVHPLLAAGWAGLFFTAINLFPLGNLSGGQIAYTLFGRRQRDIGYVFLGALFILALYYPMWFGFVLGFIYLGVDHPELRQVRNPLFFDMTQQTTRQPLDRRRQWLAAICGGIFVLSFTMRPFEATAEKVGERPPVQLAPPDSFQPAPSPQAPQQPDAPSEDNSI